MSFKKIAEMLYLNCFKMNHRLHFVRKLSNSIEDCLSVLYSNHKISLNKQIHGALLDYATTHAKICEEKQLLQVMMEDSELCKDAETDLKIIEYVILCFVRKFCFWSNSFFFQKGRAISQSAISSLVDQTNDAQERCECRKIVCGN